MKNPIKILVYSKNPATLNIILRLINKEGNWEGEGVTNEVEVFEKCHETPYQILLLGSGISSISEQRVRSMLAIQRPGIRIVQHYGGGSGLLANEIMHTLSGSELDIK
ncbi:MAG: hypothetical protein MK212_08125 [Saprospiraceae bacterium]|nr:hypothetical protein [Saprospiraceae bacterium]